MQLRQYFRPAKHNRFIQPDWRVAALSSLPASHLAGLAPCSSLFGAQLFDFRLRFCPPSYVFPVVMSTLSWSRFMPFMQLFSDEEKTLLTSWLGTPAMFQGTRSPGACQCLSDTLVSLDCKTVFSAYDTLGQSKLFLPVPVFHNTCLPAVVCGARR